MSSVAKVKDVAKKIKSKAKASVAKKRKKKITKLIDIKPREGKVRSINRKGYHHVAYQDWGDVKSKETVFCLHGLTRNSHDFDAISQRLANTSRRVICPDIAGRGKSDWLPSHHDYQLPQYNIDFTMITAKLGIDKFDLIGTSLGGMMGMIMAGIRNSPVKRLIINDIAPEVPYSALTRLSQYLGQDPHFDKLKDVEQYMRENYAPFGPMTNNDWRHMAKTSGRKVKGGYRLGFDPAIANNYKRYWLLVYFNLWRYWNKIECPVLILRGKESDFLSEQLVTKMMNRLPHAELIEFDDVGHTPTLNAPLQIDPVLEWLDKTK